MFRSIPSRALLARSWLCFGQFSAAPRGMQVWGDVVKRKPLDWLALDDTWLDWPKWCLDKYIRTHEHHGISDPEALSTLKEKLAEMCK